MARLLQCEGQHDTAFNKLKSIYDKAQEANFLELLPNIRASLVHAALLKDEQQALNLWLTRYAPDEHQKFYITKRFRLLTKARVYVSQGRCAEALYILNLLQQYAQLYNRPYFQIEIDLLKAIILYRQQEQWQIHFIETVKKAAAYSYIHMISDQGIAVLPLWRCIDWEALQLKKNYIEQLGEELKKMAELYPNYLIGQQQDLLSNKELQVIKLLAEGSTNAEVAAALEVSQSTVKFHIANILKKLGAENRVAAVNIAKDKKIF
jgi:LuxR family maltose regulon positive regulatory protein